MSKTKVSAELWDAVIKKVGSKVSAVSLETWFSPIVPNYIDEEHRILYLLTDEEYIFELMTGRYESLLQESILAVFPNKIKFVIQLTDDLNKALESKETKETSEPKGKQLSKNPHKAEIYFNPRYTFENFVVGNNNKHAHAASVAVAESPSDIYNPFFIYGGSGLGKTHLMHAIGHYILKNHSKLNALYVSSEMFTNELIRSINTNTIGTFKNKYRKVDVLLIDDIQFLEGKQSTQEEFFHTFNLLYENKKQIIISSDRAPNKLNTLDDRLTSRFQWHMVADIQPPDYETRVAILQRKVAMEEIPLDEDLSEVIGLISEKIKFNIRELEGALARVLSFSSILQEKVTVKFAKNTLKDIFAAGEMNITCDSIKKIVCTHFNIKMAEMESTRRTRNIAFPRQIAMYLCREMTENSLPKIGEYFGGKDHTTVLHAYDKIEKEIKTKQETALLIETLKEQINGK